jgi:hypothetical protein
VQLSPKKVLALIVGLGLPVAIWAGWVLGDLARPAAPDGSGAMGNAPRRPTPASPRYHAPPLPTYRLTASATPTAPVATPTAEPTPSAESPTPPPSEPTPSPLPETSPTSEPTPPPDPPPTPEPSPSP